MLERLNFDSIAPPRSWTHAVKADGVSLVFLSGMVAERLDGSVPEGLTAQATQAYANLAAALAELGASPADVVKETIYVVRWEPSMRVALGRPRASLWGDDLPASTLVGVHSLGRPEYLLEVETIVAVTR